MYSRLLKTLCTVVPIVAAFSFNLRADVINESYAFAILGEPKYSSDFTHFDYVNPAAPKGGDITLSALGTYDSFNSYASRGHPAVRANQLYDTLFTNSADEIGSYYPLIGETVRYDDKFSWAEVNINADARFQDNTPITAQDVQFSFNKFMTEGVPQYRSYYQGVKVKAISRLTVRFELPKPDKEMMLSLIGGLKVMPESFWKTINYPSHSIRHRSAAARTVFLIIASVSLSPIRGSPTIGRQICRSTVGNIISTPSATTIIWMTKWP